MQQQHRYTRESRLLTPKNFSFVFENATPVSSRTITILARKNQADLPRLGITIAKKRVKLAVHRNRLKRQIRESFRLNAHQLPNVDIVVIAKNGINDLDNQNLRIQLDKMWKRLSDRCA